MIRYKNENLLKEKLFKSSRPKRSSSETAIVCQDEVQTTVEPIIEPIKLVFKVLKRSGISRYVITLNCREGQPGDPTKPSNTALLVHLMIVSTNASFAP